MTVTPPRISLFLPSYSPFSPFLTITPINFAMSVCLSVCKKSKTDGRDSHDTGNQNVVLKSIDTSKFWLKGDKYHTLRMNTSVSICAILKRNSPNTHRTQKVSLLSCP